MILVCLEYLVYWQITVPDLHSRLPWGSGPVGALVLDGVQIKCSLFQEKCWKVCLWKAISANKAKIMK